MPWISSPNVTDFPPVPLVPAGFPDSIVDPGTLISNYSGVASLTVS